VKLDANGNNVGGSILSRYGALCDGAAIKYEDGFTEACTTAHTHTRNTLARTHARTRSPCADLSLLLLRTRAAAIPVSPDARGDNGVFEGDGVLFRRRPGAHAHATGMDPSLLNVCADVAHDVAQMLVMLAMLGTMASFYSEYWRVQCRAAPLCTRERSHV
jgi:hypothetical protein